MALLGDDANQAFVRRTPTRAASRQSLVGTEDAGGYQPASCPTRGKSFCFFSCLFFRSEENRIKRRKEVESMDSHGSWDSLRNQARKLEAQLDEQMNSYRKVVATATRTDGSENDLESGIDRSLKQLQTVISQMQSWVSSGGSEIFSHTLTRHQEILQDLIQEFYRLRSSLRDKLEHASLLQDYREVNHARIDVEANGDFERQILLKEQAAVSRSTGQMDTVISQAQATLGALVLQRSTFSGITSKIGNVSSHLPTVNNILSAIKRKKSMDTIILSLVASACTFLILIYWLTK